MLYAAKNGIAAGAEYIRFGTGRRNLILLPGLGDGLRTMKGMALPMALYYRCLAKEFTVYLFSRKGNLCEGCTTRDLAWDLADAMEELGIVSASVVGVSMGGMIAQHFAADYPEMVEKLVLAVTCSRPNPILIGAVMEWMEQARQGDHRALMDSNMQKIYTDGYYRRNKWTIPLVSKITRPKSYDRFLRQAESCLTHYSHHRLAEITAPTLVIGGEEDRCLGGDASRELAERIPNAVLKMYPGQGHGLYEEAKDFNATILTFLR